MRPRQGQDPPRRGIQLGSGTLQQGPNRLSVFLIEVARPLEHQMFEQVRRSGKPYRFLSGFGDSQTRPR